MKRFREARTKKNGRRAVENEVENRGYGGRPVKGLIRQDLQKVLSPLP